MANVADSIENMYQAAWMGRGSTLSPPVIVNIQRQPGANIITVVHRIKALLPVLQRGLPAGVDVTILTDRTETLRASVQAVEYALSPRVPLTDAVSLLLLRDL